MEPLIVNKKRADDLAAIVEIGKDKLIALESALTRHGFSIDSTSLMNVFRAEVGADAAPILLSHLSSLCMLADRRGADTSEVLLALKEGLRKYGWTERQISQFDEVGGVLERIISSESLYISIKAIHLFSTDSNHVHEYKIYTESRPVFDADRSSIKAMLLFSTLSVVASDARETETRLTVSLGYDDLKDLLEECRTAIDKLELLESNLAQRLGAGVLVYGKRLDRS